MLAVDELSPTIAGGITGQVLLAQPGTLTGTASAASGVLLDFATANTLKVRNPGNSADAAITGGNLTLSGTLTYGGVTLPSTVTGTGSMVLATSPTIAAPSITGVATFASLSATGVGTFQNGVAASASIATAGLALSSTSGFGVYFGAGVPSITTAVTGSIYMNQTGSSVATRMYVFSSASTWIAVTTAS